MVSSAARRRMTFGMAVSLTEPPPNETHQRVQRRIPLWEYPVSSVSAQSTGDDNRMRSLAAYRHDPHRRSSSPRHNHRRGRTTRAVARAATLVGGERAEVRAARQGRGHRDQDRRNYADR